MDPSTQPNNFLAFGFNRRFVEAIEFLKTRKSKPIDRVEVLEKIGYQSSSYNQLKRGQRGFPAEKERKAAYVLMEYGIRPEWLLHGNGNMEAPVSTVNEDMIIIELLREEVRELEKYVSELEQKNNDLRERLDMYESGHKPGQKRDR
jgi:hypothetical protein